MNKDIKKIELVLENCEVITIPVECVKRLEVDMKNIKTKDNNNNIFLKNLDLLILNNGNIYSNFDNRTSPIDRLSSSNDITSITYIYGNNKRINFGIDWVYKNDNPYAFESENQAQTSEMTDYRSIHININPNNVKYSLEEILDFPIGSKFKTKDGQTIEVKERTKDEKEIKITKSMTNQFFYKIN